MPSTLGLIKEAFNQIFKELSFGKTDENEQSSKT